MPVGRGLRGQAPHQARVRSLDFARGRGDGGRAARGLPRRSHRQDLDSGQRDHQRADAVLLPHSQGRGALARHSSGRADRDGGDRDDGDPSAARPRCLRGGHHVRVSAGAPPRRLPSRVRVPSDHNRRVGARSRHRLGVCASPGHGLVR
eukprot:Amastigsp_a340841_69.p4 type:complete len:149 gc:universal Amastigsp_a340841_69:790-344(-)